MQAGARENHTIFYFHYKHTKITEAYIYVSASMNRLTDRGGAAKWKTETHATEQIVL